MIRTEDGALKVDVHAPVSMNMWGLYPEFFEVLENGFEEFLSEIEANYLKAEYLLPTIIGELLSDGSADVKVSRLHDKWFGVTYKEDRRGCSCFCEGSCRCRSVSGRIVLKYVSLNIGRRIVLIRLPMFNGILISVEKNEEKLEKISSGEKVVIFCFLLKKIKICSKFKISVIMQGGEMVKRKIVLIRICSNAGF